MVAQTENASTRTAVEDGVNSPDAVVFRGDGEPKTPEGLVARLSEDRQQPRNRGRQLLERRRSG